MRLVAPAWSLRRGARVSHLVIDLDHHADDEDPLDLQKRPGAVQERPWSQSPHASRATARSSATSTNRSSGWSRSPMPKRIGYRSPGLQQVYGAVTYYLAHRHEVDHHLAQRRVDFDAARDRARAADPAFYAKLAASRQS